MKKIQHIIYFCLINYVGTFPNDLFDELWQTNQPEPQANNLIESQPKIKVESNEAQFDGRWQDEYALKGNVKVEHEPYYVAVKVEGTDRIKNEFEWWGEESAEFKEQLEDCVKEEDQDGQNPTTSEQKKIGDNSNKHLSDQNNSTDQNESVDEQQNESNECEKIESDQQKREIIQKFREMKDNYKKNRKYSNTEWVQIDRKISNGLGVNRTKVYKWIKEFDLKKETKSKFSDLEKREILKQFDQTKSKCQKAKLKISMHELDDKIAKKLGVCRKTIIDWKRKFGLSVSKEKFSDVTKIGILKKYAKIKGKNPKMRDLDIADLLKISINSLKKWKAQFKGRN